MKAGTKPIEFRRYPGATALAAAEEFFDPTRYRSHYPAYDCREILASHGFMLTSRGVDTLAPSVARKGIYRPNRLCNECSNLTQNTDWRILIRKNTIAVGKVFLEQEDVRNEYRKPIR